MPLPPPPRFLFLILFHIHKIIRRYLIRRSGSNGGCYSPPQNVDVETDFRTTGFYVQFDFVNNAPRPGGQGDQH